MPLAQRQSEVAAAPDGPALRWFTVEEAMTRLNCTDRHVTRRCKYQWARIGKAQLRRPDDGGKSRWFICETADPRLVLPDGGLEALKVNLYAKYSQPHVDRALRNHKWLTRWLDYCAGRKAPATGLRVVSRHATAIELGEMVVAEALEAEPKGYHISVRSLQEWARKAKDGGIETLVPKYGGGDGSTSRSAAAIVFFYENYHVLNGPKITKCHELTLAKSLEEGWSWPPSEGATRQWLDDHDDLEITCYHREGRATWARRFMDYIELDWEAVPVGSWFVTDHTQCDFWVRYKKDQIRPWLTAIMDCRSRCIVGWHLGPSPHQDAILAAMRMAFREHVPDCLRIDNGKDFTCKTLTGETKMERYKRLHGADFEQAKWRAEHMVTCDDDSWRGVVPTLGIRLIYAIPYSPWSKGLIERWFGTYHDQCDRTFTTYCGRNPMERPDCLGELRDGMDVPTMEQASEKIGAYIKQYHAAEHSTLRATPMAVWATRERKRVADPEALMTLMAIRGKYKVGKNGIRITHGQGSYTFGRLHPALRGLKGREVVVKWDEAEPNECFAFEVGTLRPLGRIPINQRFVPGMQGQDLRELQAEIQHERKIVKQAARAGAKRKRCSVDHINSKFLADAKQLRATGTDHLRADAPILSPVPTGFEGVSTTPRNKLVDLPSEDDSDDAIYDDIDLGELTSDTNGADSDNDLTFDDEDLDDVLYENIQLGELSAGEAPLSLSQEDIDDAIYAGIELGALED